MALHVYNHCDWYPETRSIMRRIKRAGYTLAQVDNGEGPVDVTSEAQALAEATATDEATLILEKGGKVFWVALVLGNSPGELPCNWTCDDALDEALEEHSNAWETRGQSRVFRVEGRTGKGDMVSERFKTRAEAQAFVSSMGQTH